MHATVGFIRKQAEGPVAINIKKCCMFSRLCVPRPQMNYHLIRLVCLFHFYTQVDIINRGTVSHKEGIVKNAKLMHCS